jgi:hypothetical protein
MVLLWSVDQQEMLNARDCFLMLAPSVLRASLRLNAVPSFCSFSGLAGAHVARILTLVRAP